MTKEELNHLVGIEVEQWGAAVVARLQQRLRQQKLVASAATLESLQKEALRQTAAGVTSLALAFADSGRIQDMKGYNRTAAPPIEEIESWIRSVGLSKFEYWPQLNTRVPTEQMVVNRLAWGISVAIRKKNQHRPRRWFSKPFYSTIDPLLDRLVTAYQKATGEVIGGSFKL
jgi:hypothetical protein